MPLQYIYAMLYALEEINRSLTLLPGVKLGYQIHDSCALPAWELKAVLSMVGGNTFTCDTEAGNGMDIGQGISFNAGMESSHYNELNLILSCLQVITSCPCLSDRQQYPNFFRTMASDAYQARAVAQLAIHFNWTWIGAVIADNDYGHMAVKVTLSFLYEDDENSVCLAFVETLQRETIVSDAKRAALTIQASTAKVILIFTWYTDVIELFHQLSNGDLLQDTASHKVARGVLGVAIRSTALPGFDSYIRSLSPLLRPSDEFLREFWQKEFGCDPNTNGPTQKASLPPCKGTETLEEVQNFFTDTSQLRVTYNVYLAIYAAAHALHKIKPFEFSLLAFSCLQLMQHLSQVNFTTPQDELFYFQGGDITAKYDLVNWQSTPQGGLRLVLIGRVDGFDLHLNDTAIEWSTGTSQVPVSVCSESCAPGTRKASRKGEPICCFDCILCADGEISNQTGSLQCDHCPAEFWSNTERTVCVPRQLDFLSFNETLGVTLTAVAVSGATVTTAVFVVFLHHRQTPVVRANNSELSFLLLLSLKLCFLCSLLFIGRPSYWACRFQQAAFGISFVLCVSCLQVKTIVVLAAFRSARPGAEALMKWFGPGQQRGSVCFFTSIQVIICIIWLTLSPPIPQPDLEIPGLKVTLKCAMASVVGFSVVLGYIGLLGCTSFLLAFLARKLPDNFNEAKLITFSMLIFCAVWVAFVPAYVSSPGKYAVAVEVFAILASSFGLLFCIFAPKCFIILLRPEKNTKKHLMAR
uniref:Olfactory receptor C family, r1 n=1 Tax=Oryzias latipes TaxID=8090 RepID=A0A3P9LW33_ORYLA